MKFNCNRSFILFFVGCCILSSCSTKKKAFYGDDVAKWKEANISGENSKTHTLWLIGDTGEIENDGSNRNAVVDAMSEMVNHNDSNSSIVYLGDNVYPKGMPKAGHESRYLSEKILQAQLEPLRNFKGDTYFIPGNHDWNKHKPGGLKSIKRQEEYIESFFDDGQNVSFLPNNGCGDPEVVKVNKDLVYIFIDSQWWLQNWNKEKGINKGCDIKSRGDFMKRMEEIFLKYKNDEIICMLHHPIKSNGNHGGNFSLTQHVFPMAELGVWLPLPVIGSLYPIYRQSTGSKQDITHEQNKQLVKELDDLAHFLLINVVFVSGHEHGLEYYEDRKLKYIVSGAGSKTSYIQSGGEALYARQKRGFAKIDFYENFESWVEFYVLDERSGKTVLEFKRQLRAPRAGTIHEEKTYPPVLATDTLVAANDWLKAGGFKRFMLGEQYRDMWTTPVKAEFIDLETKLGGLTPIKKGGGMASNSLRMQHHSGKQYILRSIKKDYSKLVPEGFGDLKLLDIMKDQNSASHPYGALVIPKLSEAAGIYYTTPKLTYLKHQRGLGDYNSQFPEELYLLEERPSGDWSDTEKFGYSKEIIGYVDLLHNLRTKKRHDIDQEWVLKSRMFDLWIHDWDRHDDQWRWASFKEDEKTYYRPIPRDRDQAFYKFVGLVPRFVATFLLRQFKTMKNDVSDVKGLAFNAQHFDRYFLNELTWQQWESVIDQMQNDISDKEIEAAMLNIPSEVQHTDNVDLISKLKSRKANLKKIGKKLYKFLSKEVEVVGTDNNDQFVIERNADGSVRLRSYVVGKKHDPILKFDRTFVPNETNEIRVYGLRGKDEFVVNGASVSKIKVRIIGGEGKDKVENGTKKKVSVYDSPEGMTIAGIAFDNRSNDYNINDYDREGFVYDFGLPLINFGVTPDDGVWFGGGYSWSTYGWRKDPFRSSQTVSFSVAPGSQNAVQFSYQGIFPDVIRKIDFTPNINLNFPRYENYFGLGNESENTSDDIQYNWVRMQSINVEPIFKANTSSGSYFTFGPVFQSHDVKLSEGRVSEDESIGFESSAFDRRNYVGLSLGQHLEFLDSEVFPMNGFTFQADVKHLRSLGNTEKVTELSLQSSSYIRLLVKPKLIFAYGVGYKKSWGDLQFYQYNDLGNNTNLRGYRNERFRGESIFYQNLDLRVHLLNFDNNWLPMDIGFVTGYDIGRAWYSKEISDKWHTSKTIGLYMNILGAAVLQPHYSFVDDDEGDTFSLKLGFNF